MSDETIQALERQIAGAIPTNAPAGLRRVVIQSVHRELVASKWERRLAKTAAALFTVGIGLNWFTTSPLVSPLNTSSFQTAKSDSIVEIGAAMAEATDVETGRQWALHLAALSGRTLSDHELARIRGESHNSANNRFRPVPKKG